MRICVSVYYLKNQVLPDSKFIVPWTNIREQIFQTQSFFVWSVFFGTPFCFLNGEEAVAAARAAAVVACGGRGEGSSGDSGGRSKVSLNIRM